MRQRHVWGEAMSMNPRTLRPSSTFTPRSISGLALWLDASDSSTLFQNSDGTVPATASSDPVGYWGDRSGNGRHAVQATAGNRPAISATNQGGKRALAFAAGTTTVVSPATVAQYVADATSSPKMFFAWVARPESFLSSIVFGSPTHPNNASRVFYASDFGSSGSHIVDFGSVSTARLTGVVGDEANDAGHVYSAFRDGAVMSIRRDGVEIIRKTNCTGVFSDTTGTLAINTAGGGTATASWMEFMAYAASMPAANITRVERYLAARWGITLAPQVANADAQDWINRVYANGGTVSSATAGAVNQFCDAIDAASLRSKMLRLNLFCGTGLNACLTPLYRAASLGDTQLGNATDTNQGPFAAGAYTEATGLTPVFASGHYLDTGLTPDAMPLSVVQAMHLAFSNGPIPAQGSAVYPHLIGAANNPADRHYLGSFEMPTSGSATLVGQLGKQATTSAAVLTGANPSSSWVLSRTNATSLAIYQNGSLANTNTSSTTGIASYSRSFFVFKTNFNGSAIGDSIAMPGRHYSIGAGLTGPEVSSYNSALSSFFSAIGRTA